VKSSPSKSPPPEGLLWLQTVICAVAFCHDQLARSSRAGRCAPRTRHRGLSAPWSGQECRSSRSHRCASSALRRAEADAASNLTERVRLQREATKAAALAQTLDRRAEQLNDAVVALTSLAGNAGFTPEDVCVSARLRPGMPRVSVACA
jgi:hypothetical protein